MAGSQPVSPRIWRMASWGVSLILLTKAALRRLKSVYHWRLEFQPCVAVCLIPVALLDESLSTVQSNSRGSCEIMNESNLAIELMIFWKVICRAHPHSGHSLQRYLGCIIVTWRGKSKRLRLFSPIEHSICRET